jgi:glyoxylase-like metal-dependent hydrolase (beta-lactamase superfamily II)
LLTTSAFAQQDFSSVQIQTVPVAGNLSMLVGQGGNIGLTVGADGALIVDTQFAPLSEKIQAAVTAAGGTNVRYVLNTHWHGDHTGGNANFANQGATVVAHENVKVRLQAGQGDTPPAPAAALPVVTYPQRITLHWNGVTMNLIHVDPAHTDGDTIVHFTELNAFHMGDTFFNSVYPFVDVSSNGSLDGIIAAGEMVLARSNGATRIIPGHGPLASPDDLRKWLGILREIRGRLQSMIDRGMSEEEVVAANPTAEWDAAMGGGFMNPENFTRLSYQSLSR